MPLVMFDYKQYFKEPSQYQRVEGDAAYLLEPGMKLIAEYYQDKYHLKNVTFIEGASKEDAFPFEKFIDFVMNENFQISRNSNEDIRLPFIVMGQAHSTPVVYVKEGEKEALLVFNTAPLNIEHMSQLAERVDLPVYTVNDPRQVDNLSCHTDALVFLRELAGQSNDKAFLLPHILETLQSETKLLAPNLWNVKLPDRLLKTAQRPKFVELHKKGDQIIHTHNKQPETYDAFIARYPTQERSPYSGALFPSAYVREKGLKYTRIIEIQFYLNQLKALLGDKYTDEIRVKFIDDAKKAPLPRGKMEFGNIQARKSLYDLAQQCIDNNMEIRPPKSDRNRV